MTDFIPEPSPGPEAQPLDDEHFLEPLDTGGADAHRSQDPIVRDATGRLWRLRRQPPWLVGWSWALLVGLATAVAVAVALAWLSP